MGETQHPFMGVGDFDNRELSQTPHIKGETIRPLVDALFQLI